MITTPHNVNEKEGPRVEPLRLEHLDNVYDTINAAFKDDPMSKYINEGTKEPGPRGRAVLKRIWKSVYGHSIKRRLTYTVNAGDAIIVATPAEEDIAKPSPIDSAIDFFLQAFENLFGHLTEQNKRSQELKRKVKKLSEENLGDSAKDMIHINLLATRPESQGNGYGTALLDTILFTADIRGRFVYLFSSNPANVAYYEFFGFTTIAEVVLGDDNPKWNNPPVIIPMMVREPRTGTV